MPTTDGDRETLDWSTVDPESWQPGIPWWPGVSLMAAVVALPLASTVLAAIVAGRPHDSVPQMPILLDIWRFVTAAALASGAIVVLAAPIAARLVRRSVRATLAILEVGVPAGVAFVAVVVALHAVLAGADVVAVAWLILGWALPSFGGPVAFLGLVGSFYLLAAGVGSLRRREVDVASVELASAEAPALHAMVGRLAGRLGIEPPDTVLLGPGLDIGVGPGPIRSLDGVVTGTVLHLSVPALAILSEPQLEAVLAHELAHIHHGDVGLASRLNPTYERLSASIDALESEAQGVARLAAWPGSTWLDFARRVIWGVIAEQRRTAEARADQTAAELVGPRAMASGLIAVAAIHAVEETWEDAFHRALEAPQAPLAGLLTDVRASLKAVSSRDIIEWSLFEVRPDHPALVTRLRALGQQGVGLELASEGAIGALVTDPQRQLDRLIRGIRFVDRRGTGLTLNEPRLTPGVVGWVVIGLVFGAIFLNAGRQGPLGSDGQLLVAIVTGLWLAFPVMYATLQQEVSIDSRSVRVRSWWRRWRDRTAVQPRWREVRWTRSIALTTRFEEWFTLSNGSESASWWAALWPNRDVGRLIDELRARGATVQFASDFGVQDVERHAVLWHFRGRFLLPQVRRGRFGEVLEVLPIKRPGAGAFRLTLGLSDQVTLPLRAAKPSDRVARTADLAAAANVDRETFEAAARRVRLHGSREWWELDVDGLDRPLAIPRRTSLDDVADLVIAIFEEPPGAEADATGSVLDGDGQGSDRA